MHNLTNWEVVTMFDPKNFKVPVDRRREGVLKFLRANDYKVDGIDVRYIGDPRTPVVTSVDERGKVVNHFAAGNVRSGSAIALDEKTMIEYAQALRSRKLYREDGSGRIVNLEWRFLDSKNPDHVTLHWTVCYGTRPNMATEGGTRTCDEGDFDGDQAVYPL